MHCHRLAVASIGIGRVLGRVGIDDLLGHVHSLITEEGALPVLEGAIEVPAPRSSRHVRVNGAVELNDIGPAAEALGGRHGGTVARGSSPELLHAAVGCGGPGPGRSGLSTPEKREVTGSMPVPTTNNSLVRALQLTSLRRRSPVACHTRATARGVTTVSTRQ